MHVGRTAEVPDERRAFESPVVPHAVFADVPLLVERQVTRVETPLLFQAGNHFIAVALAIRFDKFAQVLPAHVLFGRWIIR